MRPFRPRLWPRGLAARTALTLTLALALVQVAGLAIHALDRVALLRLARAHDVGEEAMGLYRVAVQAEPPHRPDALHDAGVPEGYSATLANEPVSQEMDPAPTEMQRLIRGNMAAVPLGGLIRPKDVQIRGGEPYQRLLIGMHLPDGTWLHVGVKLAPLRPWHSRTFLIAFIVMTIAAAALIWWAARRLTAPVRTLANAADELGRDVNAPPLPEDGPTEVARAGAAFNTMAARIRRFVADRTELLTAIGHDLRTPITRLKLRAEFVEDDELRRKMLADLDELEAMVAATLAFGRDAKTGEKVALVDLAELLRTVIDEAADASPAASERLAYDGPQHLPARVRALSMKRAVSNLIYNAIKYGEAARVTLTPPGPAPMIRVDVEDDGPGIPAEEMDRVFEPFHRVEGSRNRETGGVGLGLPIARNILRAHGGDVTLANRPGGGLRATMVLPA